MDLPISHTGFFGDGPAIIAGKPGVVGLMIDGPGGEVFGGRFLIANECAGFASVAFEPKQFVGRRQRTVERQGGCRGRLVAMFIQQLGVFARLSLAGGCTPG